MHRLFVALRPPPSIIAACLGAMDDALMGWAWQADEQLHLTLRYIGEVETPVAEDIASALGRVRANPVGIGLSGVGRFDHGARSALFARVSPRDLLSALHKKVDRTLVTLGLRPEGRAYLPHITLARHRRGAADPNPWLVRNAHLSTPEAAVRHITLFESHLRRDGASYEAVARYPLDG